jgi:DNA polymerase (family X)
MPIALNEDIAGRLDEVSRILAEQEANRFRVQAYEQAATVLRGLSCSVSEVFAKEGIAGLEKIPGVGETIARSIRDILLHGKLAMLQRLRGEHDPLALLGSVPGVGKVTAWKLYEDLGVESLEELEAAAHDGRLERFPGMGAKRIAGIRDSLAQRLGRIRREPSAPVQREDAPVAELLDVDRQYREEAAAGALKKIAPRRFNPSGEAWLPVFHTACGPRQYTALFSNTARAHELNKTQDWVVLYYDGASGERQCTIITSEFGPLQGKRIVRGREKECREYYGEREIPGAAVRKGVMGPGMRVK